MKNLMQTLSEMHDQRYARTMNDLFARKIPCGMFFPFYALQARVNQAIGMKNAGINLQCICVLSEPQKSTLQSEGIPILTLKEFSELESKPKVMFCSSNLPECAFDDCFRRMGVDTLYLEDVREMESKYENICRHLGDIFEVYQLLEDEESRAAYRACLKGRVSGREKDFRYAAEPQYWLEPFTPVDGDIAIDGGAYDGATSIDFASRGATVYAFEMDQGNYQQTLPRAEKYNFTLENMGLSISEQDAFYISGGAASSMLDQHRGGEEKKLRDLSTSTRMSNGVSCRALTMSNSILKARSSIV